MKQEQSNFTEEYEDQTPEMLREAENQEPGNILSRLENEFDWNLIGIVSIWIFLFATFFLIFASY